MDGPRKQRYEDRLTELRNEFQSSWRPHLEDISQHINPRRGRFLVGDQANAGQKKHGNIINSTATRASRILAAGMMAGITSPARAWFRLTTSDPDLSEVGSVRSWLHVVEERIREALQKGYVYQALHGSYASLGDFGTAASLVEDDFESLLRAYFFPVGSYFLGLGPTGKVDTFYRETTMRVGQLVRRFGAENCSEQVRAAWENKKFNQVIEVAQAIEPNEYWQPGKIGPAGMGWSSCWWEKGSSGERLLSERGYYEFPVLAPRWEVTGEDVYGSSPGMDALGDIRALQSLELKKGQLVAKMVDPPLRGPSTLTRAGLLPGDYTPSDGTVSKVEPVMVVDPRGIEVVGMEIQQHERRINGAYFADLWLMLSEGDGTQKTAREIAERHEEKMLQLGPVMERLDAELFSPLIDRTFAILNRKGDLPPAPEELQGTDIKIEFISVMHQAQKMLGIGGIDRLVGTGMNLATMVPSVLDKLNTDRIMDEYGSALGVKPDLVRSDEDVKAIRDNRSKMQAQQMAQEQAMQAAQATKTLAQAPVNQDTALDRLLSNLSPAAPTSVGGG